MNVFLYPFNDIQKTSMKNSYQDNFIRNLENNPIKIVNKQTNYGVLDVITYFNKTDIFYFNFIENLPERKFGLLQSLIFLFILLFIKIFRKKIVWVLHNKISHSESFKIVKKVLMIIMLNTSNKVITLSKEGIKYGNKYTINKKKIFFFNHPVENNLSSEINENDKDIDILIWGRITKYKGVSDFLEFLLFSEKLNHLKITIAGKIDDPELRKKITNYEIKSNLQIIDEFIKEDVLIDLHKRSNNVLFTYQNKSVLSSAALMYSLGYGANIIGPNIGAFRDLKELSLINTYESYDDFLEKIQKNENKIDLEKLNRFIEDNSWKNFAKNIYQVLKQV